MRNAGKSSITLRLVRSQWTQEYVFPFAPHIVTLCSHALPTPQLTADRPSYDPTIEDSYTVTRHIDGRTHLLTLTDTAGQEEYRALWTTATLAADAFLLVYDITSAASLVRLAPFCALVDHEAADRADRAAVPPVRIVAGNKCDLQHARQVRAAEGLAWARARGCGFMETSARDMVNVEETFARTFFASRLFSPKSRRPLPRRRVCSAQALRCRELTASRGARSHRSPRRRGAQSPRRSRKRDRRPCVGGHAAAEPHCLSGEAWGPCCRLRREAHALAPRVVLLSACGRAVSCSCCTRLACVRGGDGINWWRASLCLVQVGGGVWLTRCLSTVHCVYQRLRGRAS